MIDLQDHGGKSTCTFDTANARWGMLSGTYFMTGTGTFDSDTMSHSIETHRVLVGKVPIAIPIRSILPGTTA